VLAPSLVVSYSHDDAAIDRTIHVIGEALRVYRRALDEGIDRYLEGRPVRPVFRRRDELVPPPPSEADRPLPHHESLGEA
jgi:hypothetical protein